MARRFIMLRVPMRRGRALGCMAGLVLLVLPGCRQDMHDQPKYQPLEASSFFKDGRMEVLINIDEQTQVTYPEIELTAEIDAQLKKLEAVDID